MKSRHLFAALTLVSIAALSACGSKTDANEKNFGTAMSQYFEKRGDLCLYTMRWPVDLSEMDLRMQKSTSRGKASQMAALESAGLVEAQEIELDVTGLSGKPTGMKTRIKRYSLTDAAKPFTQEKDVKSIGLDGTTTVKQTDLCWGKQAFDRIVKWEGPMKLGDYQEAGVTYTYKVKDLAEWAKKPEIHAAFPAVKSLLDGEHSNELKHAVKLTSQGWEAKGLDR